MATIAITGATSGIGEAAAVALAADAAPTVVAGVAAGADSSSVRSTSRHANRRPLPRT